MSSETIFNDRDVTVILFAALVNKLGGKVVITQVDVDAIAFTKLHEERFVDGSLEFRIAQNGAAGDLPN